MPRFVCLSDTHNKHGLVNVPEGDILLHAGDFTLQGKLPKIRSFNKWLGQQSHKHKIIIPGNHDLSFESQWDNAVSFITNAEILNQNTATAEDIKIYGEPRQPEFNNWAFNIPRFEMQDVWKKVPLSIDILLTHGPPLGIGDKTIRGERVGCLHLREWIEENQPRLVVCGHIHEGYGLYMLGKTLIINASICDERYQPNNKPVVIDLE